MEHSKIREYRIAIDESRFFFGPDTISFIRECDAASEEFLFHISKGPVPDHERAAFADKAAEISKRLRHLYEQIPHRFEGELRVDSAQAGLSGGS